MRYKKTLQFTLFSALTVLLLWFSFKDIQWANLWQGILTANYWWVIFTVLIGIAAYFVRARRWQLLIHPLGYTPSTHSVYRAVIVGYFANLAFPRLGEIARCGTLAKSHNIPFDKLVGTVVTERLFDFICLVIIVLTTFFIKIDTFGKFLQDNINNISAKFSSPTILWIGLGLLLTLVLVILFLVKKKDNLVVKKVRKFLLGVGEGFTSFLLMRRKGEFLLQTLLLWGCYWLMTWLMLYAVQGLSHLNAADGVLTMVLGSFGVIAPTNGGLGAYHAILKVGMPILFDVSEDDSLLFATLSHESQMLFIIVLGLIAYVQVFIRNPNRSLQKIE
ncbi:dolichol-P-glucose synthetase [Bacteroidia bacterium]|nr:dolichol-P-glucose synthetase [Bacteroidia bacterium]GHT82273.1 dolichol-P-glucose synthetase [Bacteroidia bacterium]